MPENDSAIEPEINPEVSLALAKAAQDSGEPERFVVIVAQAMDEGASMAEAVAVARQLVGDAGA